MTEAVFDFADIKRRMDRKPDIGCQLSATAALAQPQPASQYGYNTATFEQARQQGILSPPMTVSNLRAYLDYAESNQIEDDGWITMWAY